MNRYIKINDQVALAKFSVPKSAKKAYVEFTRLGQTLPTLRHDPVSIDNGEAVFAWDKNARSQDQGWYTIRLFVGGCLCGEYTARVENACVSEFIGSEDATAGETTMAIREQLLGIQTGKVEDTHGWLTRLV